MATPADSVAPTTPTASSPITGVSALWTWFKNIGDWIKALSPTGANAYDTGWVAITYTDSRFSDYSGQPTRVRRIGKQVYLDGGSTINTASIINGAAAAQNVMFGSFPAEMAPGSNQYFICQGSGYEKWQLTVTFDGRLTAHRYTGSQAAGVWLPHNVSWAVG